MISKPIRFNGRFSVLTEECGGSDLQGAAAPNIQSKVQLGMAPDDCCQQHSMPAQMDTVGYHDSPTAIADSGLRLPAPECHMKVTYSADIFATDSEDESWQPGAAQSSGDDCDEGSDSDMLPAHYCINCTAPMRTSMCSDCGHDLEQDAAIFDSAPTGRVNLDSMAFNSQPVLLWDEEMLLHEEGKASPHPERPDRIRAIMARLNRSGLAGRHSWHNPQLHMPLLVVGSKHSIHLWHSFVFALVLHGTSLTAVYFVLCR